ncbi:MAG: DUF389 domain-containing protein [Deltaproteobacteria bacterium]|nr:DUF389 domain-containing protein [Deltaproteobacteria bacterium]
MMMDSNHREHARTDVSEDAEPATKHGLGRRRISDEQRQEILNELFFEGEERMPYVKHFYSLLTISALIASIGLYRNSPAVVIGAMLLSPLMTPILAFAAGLIMGWPVRSGRLAIRLFFATSFVFALAYLLPLVFRMPKNIVLPAELLARTNPKMGELLIALSAGIAAALMLLRRETLAILPGVAISVALIPPLCVSGHLTYVKEYALAWEAFVLYATNLVAIILTAGTVLLLTGFKPRVKDLKLNLRIAAGMTMITFFVALVAVPLSMRTFSDIRDLHDRQVAISVIDDWIGENSVEIVDVEVEDNLLQVFLLINLPVESLYERRVSAFRAHLSPDMTVDALKQRLIAVLDKEVDITFKGSFAFWQSTCQVPADCYF